MQSDIERFNDMRKETKEIMDSMNNNTRTLNHNSAKCKVGTLKNYALDKLKGANEKFWEFLMTPRDIENDEVYYNDYYVSPEEEMSLYIQNMEKAAEKLVAEHGTIDMTNNRGQSRVRKRNNVGSFEILLIVLIVSIAFGAILALAVAN